jgi:hypothetical protein
MPINLLPEGNGFKRGMPGSRPDYELIHLGNLCVGL